MTPIPLSSEQLSYAVGVYIVLVNILAFVLIVVDRFLHELDDKTILACMSYGGLCGGKVGMALFNHKTYRKSFVQASESHRSLLNNVALIAAYYL